MLYKTTDVYEAAYYIMNGSVLDHVVFRRADLGYITYELYLEGVNERSRFYWGRKTPIGNIRIFSYTRIALKKKISKLKKEYESQVPTQ